AAALRVDGWQNVDASTTLTRNDGSAMTTTYADASKLQVAPRVGALVHVTREVAVRASVYRAFRAPTLNELYRPFQVGTVLTAANDRLRPEALWGGEAGAQVRSERLGLPGVPRTDAQRAVPAVPGRHRADRGQRPAAAGDLVGRRGRDPD